ncbi:MAG TPA: peptide deformylase [Campylobacterales bacterium]|nr:peptide deformylase [Campylobacterales bacterium]
MTRKVITYPDKRLKQHSKDIDKFDDSLHKLLDDMYDTMVESGGIGLAAIQVGVPLNALIIELYDEDGNKISDLIEAINPKITKKEGETKHKEGCLSVPDFYEDVTRFEKVSVSYFDRYGNQNEINAEGLLSIAFQHEMDHLNGKLFFERLSILKRKKFEKEYKANLATLGKK